MGDYVRWATPGVEGVPRSQREVGALFLALNRNKRSIRLDLKSPEAGRDVLLRLVARRRRAARVLPPGGARSPRRGLRDAAGGTTPAWSTARSPATAQDGPLRDRSGHDINYLGLVGLLGLTGEADGPPVQAAGQIADVGGGALMAAFGILAALRERDRSGEGQLVDVSMADGALSWLAMDAGAHARRRA